MERNIVEWRKDLGRVEEVMKGTKLKGEEMGRLFDKYDLLEKGPLAVVMLLKIKIQSSSVKLNTSLRKRYDTDKTHSLKATSYKSTKNLVGRQRLLIQLQMLPRPKHSGMVSGLRERYITVRRNGWVRSKRK